MPTPIFDSASGPHVVVKGSVGALAPALCCVLHRTRRSEPGAGVLSLNAKSWRVEVTCLRPTNWRAGRERLHNEDKSMNMMTPETLKDLTKDAEVAENPALARLMKA